MMQQMLMGDGGGGHIDAQAAYASDLGVTPISGYAELSFRNDGAMNATGNVSATDFTWLLAGSASAYDIRVSGAGDSPGTLSTWQNLGTTRTWSLTRSTDGISSFTGTYEISMTGAGVAIRSGSFSIVAERSL
jgi:hypothetical protein